MRGFQKIVLDHVCDDGMTYLPSSPSVYKTVVGPSSEFDSCGMDHALIEMKRGISDGGNPLLFMWLSLTPSTITVMREFRYYPSDHTGLRVRADFLTGQRQSDTAFAQA